MSCVKCSFERTLPDGKATNSSTTYEPVSNNRQVNLESYQLVLIDPDYSRQDTIRTDFLRKIVDYTKIFDNNEDAQKYLEQTHDTITFLVVRKELAQEFVPQIHHLKDIRKIYIISELHNHSKCFSNYSKVVENYKEISLLLNDLSTDVNEYQQQERQVDFSKFDKIEASTDSYHSSWWYGFIRLIVSLPYPTDSCRRLIEFLKIYYEEKTSELRILSEFETTYRSNQAVWWYTRPTFLYNLLNQSLRQHNIHMTFLFGFFIQDLFRQLKREFDAYKSATLIEHHPIRHSYRGQIMHIDEIKKLLPGVSIINNSFFSTSLNRNLALMFVNPSLTSVSQFQNVLFEFEIDIRQQPSNPFADISSISFFPQESEILFMLGCKFEILDISYDGNKNYWLVKVDLDYAYNKQEYRNYESVAPNLTFRKILKYCLRRLPVDIDQTNELNINILFNELTDLFPSESRWISAIRLYALAQCLFKKSQYHAQRITYLKQAINIWNEYIEDKELNCLIDIGHLHMLIGICYKIGHPSNVNQALTHCDLAISCMKSADENKPTDYEKVIILNQFYSIYNSKMNISKIIKENAWMSIKYAQLSIQEMLKYCSEDDIMIIARISDLAENFVLVNQYDNALKNYQHVLDMLTKKPKLPLRWIANICGCIVDICTKHMQDYHLALHYQLLKLEYMFKRQTKYPTETIYTINVKKEETADTYKQLSFINIKLGEYNLAYTNLLAAMKLYEEILQSSDPCNVICKIAETKVKLADISIKLYQYDLASEYLERAVSLCEGRSELYDENITIAHIYIELAYAYKERLQYELYDEHLARALNMHRDYYNLRCILKGRITKVINGRIRRCKRSSTTVYVIEYACTRLRIAAFLDKKITTLSHRRVCKEIRRIYNRYK